MVFEPRWRLNTRCVVSSPDNSDYESHRAQDSQNQIDVYATERVSHLSCDLLTDRLLLPMQIYRFRAIIWLQDAHYNADKGEPASQRQHTFVWDNVAFDGPFTYRISATMP